MPNFQWQPTVDTRLAGSIGDIMARSGDVRAESIRAAGAAKAHAIGTIGQAAAGTLEDIMQGRRVEKQKQTARAEQEAIAQVLHRSAKPDGSYDLEQIRSTLPPALGSHLQPLLEFADKANASRLSQLKTTAELAPKPVEPPKTREVQVRQPDGSTVIKIVADTPGAEFTSAPEVKPTPAVTYGQPQVQLVNGKRALVRPGSDGKLYDANTRQEVMATPEPEKVTGGGAADGAGDVKESVLGMMDGSLPPLLPGRGTKEYIQLMAEAHRQKFDLAGAATDWMATQKHIATLNGNQQTRLMQIVNALPELLDKVDALASQWKGGRFPILNRANLGAAKGGVYGPEVASVANQLESQIADVVGDLGTVYMGGNSPTDHALGLAQKGLSGDWDEKVLHDMVKLAKSNVETRKHSINNTGVAGASADNPYAPPPVAAAAPVSVGGRSDGDEGVLNGQPVVWRTIGGQSGWMKR